MRSKILIVDDVEMNRELLKEMLADDYEVLMAENGRQALELLEKQYRLLQTQAEQLKRSKENVIDILGTVVEYRNLESGEHIKRVKGYTRILAEQYMEDYPECGLTQELLMVSFAWTCSRKQMPAIMI